jgi:D-serine deaminase-like pyridoxal phosphate-dependent protein
MQLAAGAIGLTAAKATEAEAISGPGEDVLLAYPPVGPARAEVLASLARDRTVRAAVDSLFAIEVASVAASAAGTTIGLLVDLDVGMGRTGVKTPEESLLLAQSIERAPGVRLDGIMIYPGHIWQPVDRQRDALETVSQLIQQVIDVWERHGLSASIVSGGSTPTAYQSHFVRQLTEIRPGTYVFNDMNTVRGGFCALGDCAARIVATVISNAVPGQVVIDAGSKTLSSDPCISSPTSGHGHVVEYPEARITRLTEEHGQVDVTACGSRPKVGEWVTVIPNHICPCLNLQESVWWQEPNEPPRQLKVDARGKLL